MRRAHEPCSTAGGLRRWAAVAAAALLGVTLGASSLRADTPLQQARVLFKQANKLVRQQDYPGALARYRAAYKLHPSYKIDVNIADTLFAMGPAHHAEAAQRYELYLQRVGVEVTEALKAPARKRLSGLMKQLASLRLRCPVHGASVMVGGAQAGRLPLPTRIYLTPGSHQLRVAAQGYAPHPGY